MAKVTGVGGVFFKVKDPAETRAWYSKHLGLNTDEYGTSFEWRSAEDSHQKGFTLWSPFSEASDYFPGESMVNFRVDDMAGLLEQLKADGVEIVSEVSNEEYGRFVHIIDGDGQKIELWEPVDEKYDAMIGDARTK